MNLIKNQLTTTVQMIALNPHDQNGIETDNCSLTFVIQMGHTNTSKPRQKSTMYTYLYHISKYDGLKNGMRLAHYRIWGSSKYGTFSQYKNKIKTKIIIK